MEYTVNPIGVIYSPYKEKKDCPIQPPASNKAKGRVEVYAEYEAGLKDIETFSHIILFYVFDRAGEIKLSRPTFLDATPHGIFASRHPARPNSIGISIVKLESRRGNVLNVSGIDVLDKTPLIDIKPYIPRFDLYPDATNGWTENLEFTPKPEGRE
jgi:tRNA (adenine37-N6)-methyltransferase